MILIKYRIKENFYFRVAWDEFNLSHAFYNIHTINRVIDEHRPCQIFTDGWLKRFRPDFIYKIEFNNIDDLIQQIPEEFL